MAEPVLSDELERDDDALVAFTVYGAPAPQGSKVAVPTARGHRTKESNEESLVPWRAAVTAAGVEAMAGRAPFDGPLELDVAFVFKRPRSHYGSGRNAGTLKPSAPVYCDRKPDLDKLLRAVGDALTGHVVVDDSRFVQLVARKHYGSPAAFVVVRRATT